MFVSEFFNFSGISSFGNGFLFISFFLFNILINKSISNHEYKADRASKSIFLKNKIYECSQEKKNRTFHERLLKSTDFQQQKIRINTSKFS